MKTRSLIAVSVAFALICLGALIGVTKPTSPAAPAESGNAFNEARYERILRSVIKSGVNYTIVHDCDIVLSGVTVFVDVESKLGIRSTFYLRPEADYWDKARKEMFKDLEQSGWRIGLHFSCLSRANGNETLALGLLRAQTEYMRRFFRVETARAHGDVTYDPKISNIDLFLHHPEFFDSIGLRVIDYPQFSTVITDSGGRLVEPNYSNLKGPVLILLHSDWWAK
jgi:hypothetical protein